MDYFGATGTYNVTADKASKAVNRLVYRKYTGQPGRAIYFHPTGGEGWIIGRHKDLYTEDEGMSFLRSKYR